ncbi:MAG: TSUP family transporter [Alphaproteobacteria bacterium]|nr:TSUP family transporter [Alphaproteobacteria bacterium]
MTPDSLLIMFIALAAGSLVKGISGLGLPLVAIPVMAGFMEVDRAVAIMVIPGILINVYLLWTYRNHAVNFASLPLMICVGVVGIIIGAWILSRTPEVYLLSFMGLWLGGYLISMLFKTGIKIPDRVMKHTPAIVVGFAGIVQGSIGTAGPVLAPYVHSLNLKHPQFLFVVSVLFQIFAIAQLFAFTWFGLLNVERAYQSMLACIPIVIFLPLAVWLAKFISHKAFNVIVVALLIVIEARLLWRLFG